MSWILKQFQIKRLKYLVHQRTVILNTNFITISDPSVLRREKPLIFLKINGFSRFNTEGSL